MRNIIKHTLYIFILILLLNFFLSKPSYGENDEIKFEEKITLESQIKNVANPVYNTYTYKIEPADSNIKDGLIEPKTFEVKFDGIAPDSSNKIIANYDIDFADVDFKNYGLYEYIVTEIKSSNPASYPVSGEKYKIYVQVLNENNKKVKKVSMQALDLQTEEKTKLIFTHSPKYTYLKIRHSVKGNNANFNEYLLYKLSINGNVGDNYQIIGQDDEVIFEGKKIETSKNYKVKSGENNYVYIYLKANQEVTVGLLGENIYQIPIGTKYKISSLKSRKWNTIIDEVETKDINYKNAYSDKNNIINIIQEKNFDVALTGVFINILPFVILVIIGIIGIIFSIRVKRESKQKNENI